MRPYPTFVTLDFVPFDPVELTRETERIVCRGNRRKYTRSYATGAYGGTATGYTVQTRVAGISGELLGPF